MNDSTVKSQIENLSQQEKELTDKILTLFSRCDNIKIRRIAAVLEIVESKARVFLQNVDLNGFYKGGINKQ